jgi:hypothetical protein
MKTLALEKIIEKRSYLLDRIAHRIEQMRKNEIDVEDFAIYYRAYKSEFKGYIDSMRDMKIITDEDRQMLYDSFIEEIDNI